MNGNKSRHPSPLWTPTLHIEGRYMCAQLTVLERFRACAELADRAPAIIGDGESMSYRDLHRLSDRLAYTLIEMGVTPGSLIPIEATRSAEFVVGILGILKAGAAYVPIDSRYPDARKCHILEQCHASLALTAAASAATPAAPFHRVADLVANEGRQGGPLPVATDARQHEPIYVIFTSGTTGAPKGVIVEHAAVAALVDWHNARFSVDRESRTTLMAGLGFDVSQWELWSALTAGATLYFPNDETRFDAVALVDFFARHRITHAYVPTVMVADIVAAGQVPGLALKFLVTAGEKLRPVNTDRIDYTLIDYYGPTEATIFATCHEVPSATSGRPDSIGRPIADVEILILDASMHAVREGDIGEICIGGSRLARGYLGNPEMTRTKFCPHPHRPGRKIYRTGDLGRWLADGTIQFLGRVDDQIKIRGNLVEPSEVEAALARSGRIRTAVVLALPNADGSGMELVAFIVARREVSPQASVIDALKRTAKHYLPDYMWPTSYVLIDAIPVTANGKTDKAMLQHRFHEQQRIAANSEAYTATERHVSTAFAAVLGHAGFRKADSFFDIGGHSLMTARVSRTLSDVVGTKILIRDIYEHQSVAELAREIDRRLTASTQDLERERTYLLSEHIRLPDGADFSGPFDAAVLARPRSVLLTGATGFVGIHLLAELLATTDAVIHCLVRAADEAAGRARIEQKVRDYDVVIAARDWARIEVCIGDLTKPRFDMPEPDHAELARTIDVVYHSAGAVNFIQPYSYMKKINVDGLQQVLAFAVLQRKKPLILLSTISVYSWGHLFTGKKIMTEADDIDQNLPAVLEDIGYTRSKWVMEKMADLAARHGLPLMTFRLGYATFHSKTGASASYQWWGRLVKTCIAHGTIPDLHDLREGLTTVDYMTKALAYISRNPAALGKKFNLINTPETNLTLKQFFALLGNYFGLNFQVVPFHDWLNAWKDNADAPLYPLLSLFNDNILDGKSTAELYQNNYTWDCRNTIEFLAGSGITQPNFSREQLGAYLERSIGYHVAR